MPLTGTPSDVLRTFRVASVGVGFPSFVESILSQVFVLVKNFLRPLVWLIIPTATTL